MTYTQQNESNSSSKNFISDSEEFPITERVVKISRVSKVVKGGRNLTFSAVVVVGDQNGKVGIGMGKAAAVPDAIRKGATNAKKDMVEIVLKDSTIPHEIVSKFCGSIVMLKPAAEGTGVIAGGAVRSVVELAGIKDILTKVRRSTNPVNVVTATFNGLRELRDIEKSIALRKKLVHDASERDEERRKRREMRRSSENAG